LQLWRLRQRRLPFGDFSLPYLQAAFLRRLEDIRLDDLRLDDLRLDDLRLGDLRFDMRLDFLRERRLDLRFDFLQ
jgi:hypothetical protein